MNKNGFSLFFGQSVEMVLKWREVADSPRCNRKRPTVDGCDL